MNKVLKVFWTENAVEDLIAIKNYISEDSPDRADAWILELINVGESLDLNPKRGRIVPEFNIEFIRELLISNYRLVYKIEKNKINILTVFEGHRRLSKKDLKK